MVVEMELCGPLISSEVTVCTSATFSLCFAADMQAWVVLYQTSLLLIKVSRFWCQFARSKISVPLLVDSVYL